MRTLFGSSLVTTAVICSCATAHPVESTAVASSALGSTGLVLAQVYGGGGGSTSTYKYDYVVLFNRGSTAVSPVGWSVQYVSSSAAANSWEMQPINTGSAIQPGGWFLVQMSKSSGSAGLDLPAVDAPATADIGLSATNGIVALVNDQTRIAWKAGGARPSSVVDVVGYGTAVLFEGAKAAPALSATDAAWRFPWCDDTDDNSADFVVSSPGPVNSTEPKETCPPIPVEEAGVPEAAAPDAREASVEDAKPDALSDAGKDTGKDTGKDVEKDVNTVPDVAPVPPDTTPDVNTEPFDSGVEPEEDVEEPPPPPLKDSGSKRDSGGRADAGSFAPGPSEGCSTTAGAGRPGVGWLGALTALALIVRGRRRPS